MNAIRTHIASLKAKLEVARLRFLRLPPKTRLAILALIVLAILASGFILIRSIVVAVASRGPAALQAIVVDFPDADEIMTSAEERFTALIDKYDLVTMEGKSSCYLVLDDLSGTIVGDPSSDDWFEVLCGPVLPPGKRNGAWIAFTGEVSVKRDGSAFATLLDNGEGVIGVTASDARVMEPFGRYDEFHSLINPKSGETALQGDAGALDLGTDAESLSLDVEWIEEVKGFTPSGEPYRSETLEMGADSFMLEVDDPTIVEVLVEAYPYLEDAEGNRVSPPSREHEFLAVRLADPGVIGKRAQVTANHWMSRDERYYRLIDRVEFGGIDLPADGTPIILVVHEDVSLREAMVILLSDDLIMECVGEQKYCYES